MQIECIGIGKDKPMLDLHLGVFGGAAILAMPSADSDYLVQDNKTPFLHPHSLRATKVRGNIVAIGNAEWNSNGSKCGVTVERALGNLL